MLSGSGPGWGPFGADITKVCYILAPGQARSQLTFILLTSCYQITFYVRPLVILFVISFVTSFSKGCTPPFMAIGSRICHIDGGEPIVLRPFLVGILCRLQKCEVYGPRAARQKTKKHGQIIRIRSRSNRFLRFPQKWWLLKDLGPGDPARNPSFLRNLKTRPELARIVFVVLLP